MPSSRPMISIIVPVLNEERTISSVLDRLNHLRAAGQDVQILVVDDGSTDGTGDLLAKLEKPNGLIVLGMPQIVAKCGFPHRFSARYGTGFVIQDADLEYDPAEILTR